MSHFGPAETLNDDRRNFIDEKFKNLSSGVEKLQALDKRLNDLDQQINSLEKEEWLQQ